MKNQYEIGKSYSWRGGNRPVHEDTIITVIFQNGQRWNNTEAWEWDWDERGEYGIVEFIIEKFPEGVQKHTRAVIFLNEYDVDDGSSYWSIRYNTREEAEDNILKSFGTYKRTVRFVESPEG